MRKNLLSIAILVAMIWISPFVGLAQEPEPKKNDSKSTKANNVRLKMKTFPTVSSRGCRSETGLVRLRVTFHSSGKVTAAEFVELSDCEVFNERAKAAIEKIKFQPEIRDGEAVTITKPVEFTWRRY